MRVAALALALLVACQGGDGDKPKAGSAPPPTIEAGAANAGVGVDDAALPAEDAPRVDPEPERPADPSKLINELGAIPAWQAVIDRAQFLGRRGQRGVVYGTLGGPILVFGPTPEPAGSGSKPLDAGMVASPYVWLVDDTDGNGTLGIRVLLGKEAATATATAPSPATATAPSPATAAAAAGDRVALGGAWQLDEARRWYWKVDALTALPPAPPSDLKDPPAPYPSHEIAQGSLPAGARTITVARDNDLVYFQIVGPAPVRDGDGWLVANELGDVPFARLVLPGERASYGAQDMRAADERWTLKRATTYWVRIGKIRKSAKPDEPANINARTAPVKLN